jgi:hypothetical protein
MRDLQPDRQQEDGLRIIHACGRAFKTFRQLGSASATAWPLTEWGTDVAAVRESFSVSVCANGHLRNGSA